MQLRSRIAKATRGGRISEDRTERIKSTPLINNRGKAIDQRISVCTDCRKGIFNFHDYLWTKRGLCHRECDDEIKDVTPAL